MTSSYVDWVAHLEEIGAPDYEVTLPSPDDLPALLLELTVPHEDINDLVALRPSPAGSAETWWLLERATHSLILHQDALVGPPRFPELPASLGRYFFAYVYLAALPHVRAYHRRRGIPEDVSRLTLADLGRNMAVRRQSRGEGGLESAFWLMLHFRGMLYQLGRLQFERTTLGTRTGNAVAAAGLPYGPGDPVLSVHVPALYGPLTPTACAESFAAAARFFPRHFPEVGYPLAVCHSWLLDEQLAEYLPAESNIVRFQRRFTQAYRRDDDDEDIQRFVFGRPLPLDEQPRNTSLERAVGDHLRAGRHWRGGSGWVSL